MKHDVTTTSLQSHSFSALYSFKSAFWGRNRRLLCESQGLQTFFEHKNNFTFIISDAQHQYSVFLSRVIWLIVIVYLTLSRSTSVINIPNPEHIHASDKYILSFISVRSFANKKGLSRWIEVRRGYCWIVDFKCTR